MKFWILTTEYPPEFGGGIGTYVSIAARMLRDKGHSVTVFLYQMGIASDRISIEDGIRIIRFPPTQTNASKFLGFNAALSYEYAKAIEKYIQKEGAPDILESQEYHGIAYYTQQFKLLGYESFKDLNILITCHAPSFICLEYNHIPVYQLPYYWTGLMEKSTIKCADILVSPSYYFVEQAKQRMDWTDTRAEVIPNPIDIPDLREQSINRNHIVCFGKLSPLKGSFELLRYFKELWDNGFEHPLHIIGGTEQIFHPEGLTMGDIVKEKYARYIESGLLVLEGNLSPEKARAKVINAHVVIVPSTFDNFPYTVLEAMSWGKVLLVSQSGGQSEMIEDGFNGFIFDHDKPREFHQKLELILTLSNKELAQIGKRAHASIKEKYAPDVIYNQKIRVIQQYLANKPERKHFPFLESAVPVNNKSQSGPQNELLSVVIPYYNMGDYIRDCVRSVLNADYPEMEVIIVNDGSTEPNSISILKEFEDIPNVKVIHKKNEGLSICRNIGAQNATGKYLAFLDADDMVAPDYYSKAIRTLRLYDNVHFVGTWIKYFGESQDTWPSFNPEPPYILVHNLVNSSSLVYKKNTFLEFGQNDHKLVYGMEDWDSVISLISQNKGGVVLPEPLFFYRIRKNSMARAFTHTKRTYLYRLISQKHATFYNRYGHEIANILNQNGSGIYIDNPTLETSFVSGLNGLPISSKMKEKIKELAKRNRHIRKVAYTLYKNFK
ncbi:glycosyltransferase [Flavihumibacter rivuli]|uniref:glycosyltransferase n=1 Tax=Flavihumibacter rivuli TaxID=2838156 RepID=UPI001BDEF7DC|nr:glycosyltransferase [Flavihumibacter rivuli]ULQ56468.1 glycosyltransferase [Flavihumibacter rivuli]